jgi:hypothetical protein
MAKKEADRPIVSCRACDADFLGVSGLEKFCGGCHPYLVQINVMERKSPNARWRARAAVTKAIKNEILVRPDHCSRCGGDNNGKAIHAHHESYEPDQRLNVIWLCASCHRKRHNPDREKFLESICESIRKMRSIKA